MSRPKHRVAVYADIHYPGVITKWAPWIPPADLDVEAIVLAGDIHGTPEQLQQMLEQMRETQHDDTIFVVVPGNGEFLGQELDVARDGYAAAVASVENARWVDDATVELPSGLRVIGSVLWDEPTHDECEKIMQMFANFGFNGVDGITIGGKPLQIEETFAFHRKARAYIEGELRGFSPEERRETIVATHFWPRLAATKDWPIYKEFIERELTAEEAAQLFLDPFIEDYGPLFWVLGHVHERADFTVGPTRFVCNPYLGEKIEHADPKVIEYGRNPDFDDRFILEF